MKKLDLHGIRHEEVFDIVENFILLNYYELPVSIITGLSDKMKEIVQDVLESHNFKYDILPHNAGEIIVLEDNDNYSIQESLW